MSRRISLNYFYYSLEMSFNIELTIQCQVRYSILLENNRATIFAVKIFQSGDVKCPVKVISITRKMSSSSIVMSEVIFAPLVRLNDDNKHVGKFESFLFFHNI